MENFNQLEQMDSAKSRIEAYQNQKMGFVKPDGQAETTDEKDNIIITFEKEEFVGAHQTSVTTANLLAKNIANKMSKVFSDLAGAIIVPGIHGQPELVFYFRDVPAREGIPKALVQIKDKLRNNNNSNYSESAQALQSMTSIYKTNKVYDLNDDAKKALSRFMLKDANRNINWGQRITEQGSNGYNGGGEILVKVSGLNLIEFIKAIYGYKYKTTVNGSEVVNYYDYTINLISPVNAAYNIYNNRTNTPLVDYAITISAIDRTELQKVAQIFGQPTAIGAVAMCIPEM